MNTFHTLNGQPVQKPLVEIAAPDRYDLLRHQLRVVLRIVDMMQARAGKRPLPLLDGPDIQLLDGIRKTVE